MKKITVPELKASGYLVCDIKDLGRCVVVPGAEFDPDWAVCLEDSGYKCIDDVLDGAPVTFVVLGGARSNEVVEVGKVEKTEVKTKSRRPATRGETWTEGEDEVLVGLWNQVPQLKVAVLIERFQEKFPSRSSASITNHLWNLQKAGRIVPRFTIKRKGKKGADTASKAAVVLDNKSVGSKPEVVGSEVLSQAYDALSRAYAELKTDFEDLKKRVADLEGACTYIPELQENLAKHQHAVGSGKAMLPMEAP